MSTILVTGASGFVGRNLVTQLLKDKASTRILTRDQKRLPKRWGDKVDIWTGDLTEPDTLSGIAEGIDSAYHLAGEIRDTKLCDMVNRVGTESLLAVCRSAGVQRFLYLSSVGVMGAQGQDGTLDETTPAVPLNVYETSKYAGERAALLCHDASGMQVTVLRPTIVYGEGRHTRNDSFLSLVQAIKAGRFVQLGRGYVSSYVYVGDVVAACLAVVNDARTGGKIYIINEPTPLSTFIAELSAILGVREPHILPDVVGRLAANVLRKTGRFASLYNRTVYSVDSLTELGFALPLGYRQGLRRTVQWYREQGAL